MSNTLYDILEVSPNASSEVVRSAYRTLSQRYHPDKNAGDKTAAELMAQINRAYAILSDPLKRKSYDASLSTTSQQEADFYATSSDSAGSCSPIHSTESAHRDDHIEPTSSKTWVLIIGLMSFIAMIFLGTYVIDKLKETENAKVAEFMESMAEKESDAKKRTRTAYQFFTGNQIPRNYEKARELYMEIAKKDPVVGYQYPPDEVVRALRTLGDIYANGLGVPVNWKQAIQLYEEAANKLDDGASMVVLAETFESGKAVPRDLVVAYSWYNKAAAKFYYRGPFDMDKTIEAEKKRNQLAKKRDELAKMLSIEELRRAQNM